MLFPVFTLQRKVRSGIVSEAFWKVMCLPAVVLVLRCVHHANETYAVVGQLVGPACKYACLASTCK